MPVVVDPQAYVAIKGQLNTLVGLRCLMEVAVGEGWGEAFCLRFDG